MPCARLSDKPFKCHEVDIKLMAQMGKLRFCELLARDLPATVSFMLHGLMTWSVPPHLGLLYPSCTSVIVPAHCLPNSTCVAARQAGLAKSRMCLDGSAIYMPTGENGKGPSGELKQASCFPAEEIKAQRGRTPGPGPHSWNFHASSFPSPPSMALNGSKVVF